MKHGKAESRAKTSERSIVSLRLRTLGPFLALLVVYSVATVGMSFFLPALSGPNEPLHYEYVALIRQTGKLPDPSTSLRPDERHQPPIYYTLAALASLPFPVPPHDTELEGNPFYIATHRGNLNPVVHATPATVPVVYVGRLVSVLFGVLGLIGTYVAARQTLPGALSLLVTSLVAFHPMYLYLGAVVSNDLAVAAICAWVVAYTTFLILKDSRPIAFLLWGVLFALAMLAKANAVFLVPFLLIACLARWRSGDRLWPVIQGALWAIAGTILVYAPWLAFNHLRGQDPLGIGPSISFGGLLGLTPGDFVTILPYLGTLWRSFWLDWSAGQWGYAPAWFYVAWGLALLFALAGWLRRGSDLRQPIALFWMHLIGVLTLGALFLSTKPLIIKEFRFMVPEGRLMVPALPSLAWLVGVGWARWWPQASRRHASILAAVVTMVTTLLFMILFLPKLYPQAQELADATQIPSTAQPVGLLYNEEIELVAIESEPLSVGRMSGITLYWRAEHVPEGDYTVSTQLLVPQPGDWDRLDWQNSFPGAGLSPTSDWQPGVIYQDRVILHPQGELNGPTHATLAVWMLEDETTLSAARDGQEVDLPVGQEVVVHPVEPLFPGNGHRLADPVSFGGLFDLVGISHSSEPEGLVVTLWWQARDDVLADYTTFVHLLNADGQLVAQHDAMPDRGRSPTRLWRAGDSIRDMHRLDISVPANSMLLIGAYDSTTLARLPASQGRQPLPDNVFRLALP